MDKRKGFVFVILLTVITAILFGNAYYSYISRKIFNESATHLTEIYSQVGKSLSNLLTDNWSAMKMWIPYLKDAGSDENIRDYIYNIRATSAFTDFYFLSDSGSYCTIDGNKGSMDLGKNMKKLMNDKENVVSDTALIDHSELVVFAVPCPQSRYMDFSYSAIAISFNNKDIVSLLSARTFKGQAVNYVIYPIPVVATSARSKKGLEKLLSAIEKSASGEKKRAPNSVTYTKRIESAVSELMPLAVGITDDIRKQRFICLRLLQNDDDIKKNLCSKFGICSQKYEPLLLKAGELMSKSEKPFTDEIVSCIFITAEGIAAESVKKSCDRKLSRDRKIDRILTGKLTGIAETSRLINLSLNFSLPSSIMFIFILSLR